MKAPTYLRMERTSGHHVDVGFDMGVDLDGDGDVDIGATVDPGGSRAPATCEALCPIRSACSASSGSMSISELSSAKHYKIARGEAMESAASLDIMKLRQLVTAAHYDQGIRLLEGVVAMLTKMV